MKGYPNNYTDKDNNDGGGKKKCLCMSPRQTDKPHPPQTSACSLIPLNVAYTTQPLPENLSNIVHVITYNILNISLTVTHMYELNLS